MSDFDDLRDLTDDEGDDDFSEFSFDDIVDDDDYAYGQEIGADDGFDSGSSEPGPVNVFVADLSAQLGTMSAQQRLILAAMLFGNILVLSMGVLLVTGRIG